MKWWWDCEIWEEVRVCFKLIYLAFVFRVILKTTCVSKGGMLIGFSKTTNNAPKKPSLSLLAKRKQNIPFPRVDCCIHIQSHLFLPFIFRIQMQYYLNLEDSSFPPSLETFCVQVHLFLIPRIVISQFCQSKALENSCLSPWHTKYLLLVLVNQELTQWNFHSPCYGEKSRGSWP